MLEVITYNIIILAIIIENIMIILGEFNIILNYNVTI